MAKQMEGGTDKLLSCAKKEFLEKGFKDASLRVIAENANTSTSSIYTRFKDKAGIFNALVKSTADNFEQKFQEELDIFDKMAPMNWDKMLEYTDNLQNLLIDMIYDDFSAFKLLVYHAEGTVFSDFKLNVVEYDAAYTMKYIESIGNDAIVSKRLTPELLHILCSSYWSGIFEIAVHDMSKEDANVYIRRLKQFFSCG
ncbi:DNA-binding transcriptional repressor AcrR [Anaerotignum neopropionicum]|uniref:DNA-binding transcriptional repressor AcrR n=1 Tax=Anaerotignum neopropionicum TaxID=36847 RepID=A0A136WDB0_9FIRM|nr:TetR/AcrR family transcriptional regulator [Anaerotignum neopropionicum]KXL52503.1 DNA-binding transcriptional repressor AcrR [Anaerotignum neopropionicum]